MITDTQIIAEVCEAYEVTEAELLGRCRKQHLAWARHVAAYLLRERLGWTLERAGRRIGGRDHSSVVNSSIQVQVEIARNAKERTLIESLGQERTMVEQDLQRAILDAFEALGIWAIRINSGKVPTRGGWYSGAPAGTPDIHVMGKGWIEVKAPGWRYTGTPTEKAQLKFAERCAREGIHWARAMSVREAIEAVRGWG